MDTSDHYTMQSLFEQLGLPAQHEQIETFISKNKLADSQRVYEAEFWTPAQASFLRESIEEDADWAELVDHLDVQLHK